MRNMFAFSLVVFFSLCFGSLHAHDLPTPLTSTIAAQGFKLMFNDAGEVVQIVWADGSGPTTTDPGAGSDPMTTRGDMTYRDPSNTTARLGVGTSGQVVTTDGTDVSWGNAGSGANVGLSNLVAPSINTSLISDTDSTDDLGSSSIAWLSGYFDNIRSITANPLSLIPFAGQDLTISLSTTGDLVVNTDDLFVDTSSGRVGIGTATPDNLLHPEASTALINTITYPLRISHISSSTTNNGVGLGFEFEQEGNDGTSNVISSITSVLTDAGTGTEDGVLNFNVMVGAAAASEHLQVLQMVSE